MMGQRIMLAPCLLYAGELALSVNSLQHEGIRPSAVYHRLDFHLFGANWAVDHKVLVLLRFYYCFLREIDK